MATVRPRARFYSRPKSPYGSATRVQLLDLVAILLDDYTSNRSIATPLSEYASIAVPLSEFHKCRGLGGRLEQVAQPYGDTRLFLQKKRGIISVIPDKK